MSMDIVSRLRCVLKGDKTAQAGADEIERLRTELTASREREARLAAKLEYALRQNDLDMLLTGDEIRDCRGALAEGAHG